MLQAVQKHCQKKEIMGTKMNVGLLEGFRYLESARHPISGRTPSVPHAP